MVSGKRLTLLASPPPVVDVVVLTHDSRELVLDCLARLGDPAIERLIVVDNASSDGTEQAIREAFPDVHVVRLDEHGGISRGYNEGAAAGSAEYILFLNDDILADDGSVSALLEELGANPRVASAGGRLLNPGERTTQLQYNPHRFPTPLSLGTMLSGVEQLWPANPWSGDHLRHPADERRSQIVDQPAGAALMVRRAVFEAIGGWDTGYWFWFEDVDLSRRLAEQGEALFVPRATFEHLGGATVGRWTRADALERFYHGILRYAAKFFSPPQRVAFALALIAFALPRILVFTLLRRPELARLQRTVARAALALMRGRAPVLAGRS